MPNHPQATTALKRAGILAPKEPKDALAKTGKGIPYTITHHHAVGRDHRPWYDRQRPDPFAAAMRAAKAELDPRGLLNPGVLWEP